MRTNYIIAQVEHLFNLGFLIIPSRSNGDGIYKIPVWEGSLDNQEWNFRTFKEKVKSLKAFGFGVLAGLQANGFYLSCIDVDVDDFIDDFFFNWLKNLDREVLRKIAFEKTQNGRYHIFFLTKEKLIKIPDAVNENWIKIKDGKQEQGKIEFFPSNKFIALYRGIFTEKDLKPALLDLYNEEKKEFITLSVDEAKRLLKSLKFEFEYLTEEEKNENDLKTEFNQLEKAKYNNNQGLKTIIQEIKDKVKIEDLLKEYSGTFRIVNKRNNRLDCLCPFKHERNPSFKIFKTQQGDFWADFHGKHEGYNYPETIKEVVIGNSEAIIGDVIDIYRIFTSYNFKNALINLGERAGISKEKIEFYLSGKEEEDLIIPSNLFKSFDSKLFYKIDLQREEVYIGRKEDALLWILEEVKHIKLKDRQKILAELPKTEIRFLPDYDFGYNPEQNFINVFKRSEFMERYKNTEKTENINYVSYEDISDGLFKDYIKNIFLKDDDFRAFISFLALKLAGKKAGYILLFQTNQGAGKSNILTPLLKRLFGERYISELDYSTLRRDFNPLFENKYLIILEEMHIKDKGEDKHIYEHLKRASRGKKITINKKGINEYEIDFYADFIGYSNKNIPINISDTDDTRIILIQNFESVDFQKILKSYGLTLEEGYQRIEKEFFKFVEDVILKISEREARLFLEEYIQYQNQTIKKELFKATDKLLLLIEEYQEIDEYFIIKPRDNEDIKAMHHVKSGLATLSDITRCLKLIGDSYYTLHPKLISSVLIRQGIFEIRTDKSRLKILNKDLAGLSSSQADRFYHLVEQGLFGILFDEFKIRVNT